MACCYHLTSILHRLPLAPQTLPIFFGLDIEEFWLRHMGITAQDDQLKAISHRPAVAPVEALILESMWVIFPSDLD